MLVNVHICKYSYTFFIGLALLVTLQRIEGVLGLVDGYYIRWLCLSAFLFEKVLIKFGSESISRGVFAADVG